MTALWLRGLVRHRGARLLATSAGIALAVALIVSLGSFLSTSRATMTDRARASVAVDWQVQVAQSAHPQTVLKQVQNTPGVATARRVRFATSPGLQASTGGTTQTTGAAVVLGLPSDYRSVFPAQIRQLSGSRGGVLIAQQTAANLHVRPGDRVSIARSGTTPLVVTVAGVVDLPQADTLFQKVGAPPQSQPNAPPDNVVLLPDPAFSTAFTAASAAVTTQVHVARDATLPSDPAAAYEAVVGAAHHLEAGTAGAVLVGDNLGAALAAARSDAAYAQMLFLLLGLPGAVLAALLTSAAVGAGADRRRSEQSLLRVRGVSTGGLVRLAAAEAVVVAGLGSAIGVIGAVFVDRVFLAPSQRTGTFGVPLWWSLAGILFALVVAAGTVLLPTVRDLQTNTVNDTTHAVRSGMVRLPWWLRYGLDVIFLVGAGIVFWASSSNNYSLVLAPEGVATVSVSYWAFLGPVLLWLGAAALLTRIVLVVLAHARRPLAAALRPLTGRLATPGAASLSRQRPGLARAVVLLALALSFTGSTATFNATYQQQAEADAQLTNGADVAVTEPPASQVTPQAASALAAVPGVRRVEPIQHRFAYVGADLQDLYGVHPATVGSATALRDGYFQGGTAAQLIGSLATRPDGILVSAETVKDFQLKPGDRLNLRLQDGRTKTLKTVAFHFAGIVSEFPTAPKDSFFVANADYVAKATGNDAVGAFLLDTGGTDQKAVAARVQAKLGPAAAVTDITSTRGRVGSSLTSVDLGGLTRLELTFAILLAVAAGGLVLGIGLAERRRSLAIMSVLGARRGQLRGLVLGEGMLITVGGLLGGLAIGATLSLMLVKVLTGVFDPPPSSLAVPVAYLLTTGVAVTAALGAAALVGARASTRPAVEELRDL